MRLKWKLIPLVLSVLVFSPVSAGAEGTSQDPYSREYYDLLIQNESLSPEISYEDWSQDVKNSLNFENADIDPGEEPIDYDSKVQSVDGTSSGFTLKKGDVLVTNGTSSAGLTGHAGIAISSTHIISIIGTGYTPSTMSFIDWKAKYNKDTLFTKRWTKVYRVGSTTYATNAGTWAYNNYYGKSYKYGVTSNYLTKDPTYCSKIVWQAYLNAGTPLVYQPTNTSNIVFPYELPNYFTSSAKLSRVAYID